MITYAFAYETAASLIKSMTNDTACCLIDFEHDQDDSQKEDVLKKSDKFCHQHSMHLYDQLHSNCLEHQYQTYIHDSRYSSADHSRIIECPPELMSTL